MSILQQTMVITKREDVTKQGFCKTPSSGKSLIITYSILLRWKGERGGVGLALIEGWALINFFCLKNGCLFE